MFHTVAYHLTSGAAAQTNTDVPAVTPDSVLTTRNSHFIYTDQFFLALAYAFSATMTLARMNAPTINAFGRHQIWPLDSTGVQPAVVPDLPAIDDYRRGPVKLPMEEEVAWEFSDTAVVAEDAVVLNWLATPDHNFDMIPSGLQRLTLRATYSITSVAYSWTNGNLTFSESVRGGWYSVVGLAMEDPNTIAGRLLFPRARTYSGRILRPGVVCQNSFARRPWYPFSGGMGVYGKFHSFELPTIDILAVNAAAHTGDCRLDVVYHGEGAANEPSGY